MSRDVWDANGSPVVSRQATRAEVEDLFFNHILDFIHLKYGEYSLSLPENGNPGIDIRSSLSIMSQWPEVFEWDCGVEVLTVPVRKFPGTLTARNSVSSVSLIRTTEGSTIRGVQLGNCGMG